MGYIKCFFLFVFFIHSNFLANSQSLRLGLSAKSFLSYPFFNNSYIHQSMRYRPLISFGIGFLATEKVAPKLDIETGFHIIRLGYKTKYISNYVGGQRITHTHNSNISWSLYEVPIGIKYQLSKENKKWQFYIHLGVNVFFTTRASVMVVSTTTLKRDIRSPNPPDLVIQRETLVRRFTKVNPFIKISMEKKLEKQKSISIGLIHHEGLTTMYNNNVSYQIDGEDFKNHIYIRGSYTGLQMVYFLSLFRKQLSD